MNATELRAAQAPFKDRYRSDPATAFVTMRAEGELDPASITCRVAAGHGAVIHAGATAGSPSSVGFVGGWSPPADSSAARRGGTVETSHQRDSVP